jgi:hypothetical protein
MGDAQPAPPAIEGVNMKLCGKWLHNTASAGALAALASVAPLAAATDNLVLECALPDATDLLALRIDTDAMNYTRSDADAPEALRPIARITDGWIYLTDFEVHSPDWSHVTELVERVHPGRGEYQYASSSPYFGYQAYSRTCRPVE